MMTAHEYLSRYEPHVLDLLTTSPEEALQSDTERAHKIADTLGFERNGNGSYPEAVWLLVFR